MKKITSQLLFTILPAFVGFAQGSQDFETQTALTTTYADGSFTENGITYTFVHSRDEGDYSITGKGIMLRRMSDNSHLEWTIPNGIGTLTFDARKAFSGGNNNRQLEVLVNGTSVWTSPTFGDSGEDATVHNFSVTINQEGSTTIHIKIGGTATGNRQVTIDNISWTAAQSCIVNIPDPNFKNALLTHFPMIDTNGDGEIQCSEAEAYTGAIELFNIFPKITDLTGIEAFVNITSLDVGAANLTTLDLSSNTSLEVLSCDINLLTSLDVSNNTALTLLRCGDNQLTTLDISNNTALMYLWCNNNQLTTLDISTNTALKSLYSSNNLLTSLDVSANTALIHFWCNSNQLTSLDISTNTALTDLWCNNNQLTSLDVSTNTDLEELSCTLNQLVSLKIKNGNNTNIQFFDATYNPDLICIEVDDVDYSTVNWINIDSQTAFSENCGYVSVNDITNNINISFYPNPVNNMLHFSSNQPIENVTISNMLGQQINVSVSSDKTSLDLSNLQSGNYFVKVTIDGVAKTIKIIKK